MKILITNDDGINSPVLKPLAKWAMGFGEVTVVAPKVEQSAKSHAIELKKPFEIKESNLFSDIEGVKAYSVDSTPADCVRCAVLVLGGEYDIVISGINRGLNMGDDIAYSGTIGAAFEAVFMGMKALALSTLPGHFDEAVSQLDIVYDFVFGNDLYRYNPIYNVNIPVESHGVKITKQGSVYYSDKYEKLENDMYLPVGFLAYQNGDDLTFDTHAVSNGYISVTPLSSNDTEMCVFRKLGKMFN